MSLERLVTALAYIAAIAYSGLLVCFGVVSTFPSHFMAWFTSLCICSMIAISSSAAELVLRRRMNNTPSKIVMVQP